MTSRTATRQPLYRQTAAALSEILENTEPGAFLPSEPRLARELGVSRATLREAMRTFEDQGLIVRRRGIGTYVSAPPKAIDTGLEVLESVASMAKRLGFEVEMSDLSIKETWPSAEEKSILDIPPDQTLLTISRILHVEGIPAAYLVDVLPQHYLPSNFSQDSFKGSILDLFLERGDTELGYSRTKIAAIAASVKLADDLDIEHGSVVLELEATLYTRKWRALDHSLSYFLPEIFRFHVMRRVGT